jgi:Chondroitin N-acetylgalactosaminyltransferase
MIRGEMSPQYNTVCMIDLDFKKKKKKKKKRIEVKKEMKVKQKIRNSISMSNSNQIQIKSNSNQIKLIFNVSKKWKTRTFSLFEKLENKIRSSTVNWEIEKKRFFFS